MNNSTLKRITENPRITDDILFELDTPGFDGCYSSNPYKVNKVSIYFVSRDFNADNFLEYEKKDLSIEKLEEAKKAEIEACNNPTEENILLAKKLRSIANDSEFSSNLFYKEALPVHVLGTEEFPAWLEGDEENSALKLETEDLEGNPVNGRYTYIWSPKMMREGDYFICWTWTPLAAGKSLSKHSFFRLNGDTQRTTAIPTHFTNPKKYKTLLERYTPGLFRDYISSDDLTPKVFDKMNNALSLGFNVLEDFANQIVDLHDSNALHEFLIPYLSNYFGLKLKTDDPTKWRKQVKTAIPIYKKKGTREGLKQALSNSGVKLNRIDQLWQVISPYSWQESFFYDGSNNFFLEKNIIEIKNLWLREGDSNNWTELDHEDYLDYFVEDGKTILVWTGGGEGLELIYGDEIRVLYNHKEIPTSNETNENYIKSLELMDKRETKINVKCKTVKDSNIIRNLPINSKFEVGQKIMSTVFPENTFVTEIINYTTIEVSENAIEGSSEAEIKFKSFEFPPKNWNVRLISEFDPMFDVIVPNRNPFFDPLVFGKVRTEFPYSENIYNMEEYNGSIRDSKDPCDIDKEFVDPCHSCISSSYNIDVEVDSLSDEMIEEVKDILKENTPFHSILNKVNFLGSIEEFVASPLEKIEMLVTTAVRDFVVSGESSIPYFMRNIINAKENSPLRSQISQENLIHSEVATGYNDNIICFCPDEKNINRILSNSYDYYIRVNKTTNYDVHSGENSIVVDYSQSIQEIDSPFNNQILDTSAFVFDLNKKVSSLLGESYSLEQKDVIKIKDKINDISDFNIITEKDDINNAWSVTVTDSLGSSSSYPIRDINSQKHIEFIGEYNNEIISYELRDTDNNLIMFSNQISIEIEKVGLVTLTNLNEDINKYLSGPHESYQIILGTEYKIYDVIGNQYKLFNYQQGAINNTSTEIITKYVDNKIGYFSYEGLNLTLNNTNEASLGIQNGTNGSSILMDDNSFKENFIILIDNTPYGIGEINNNEVKLKGKSQYWGLSGNGTNLNIEIYKYENQEVTIPGQRKMPMSHTFNTVDRSGRSILYSNIEDASSNTETDLYLQNENEFKEGLEQKEEISFEIEYREEKKNDE